MEDEIMMNYGFYNQTSPMYQQAQQMPYSMQNQAQDERIWVQGLVGAKAYLVAPRCTAILWDSEAKKIYIKSVTYEGFPSIQTLTYTEEEQHGVSDYITREEFERRIKEVQNVSESGSDGSAI